MKAVVHYDAELYRFSQEHPAIRTGSIWKLNFKLMLFSWSLYLPAKYSLVANTHQSVVTIDCCVCTH